MSLLVSPENKVPHVNFSEQPKQTATSSFVSRIVKVVKASLGLQADDPAAITNRRWSKQRAGEISFAALLIITGVALMALAGITPPTLVVGTLMVVAGIGGLFYDPLRSRYL